MLASFTADNWISILGIILPLVGAILLVTWKWQTKQDTQINEVDRRVVVAETKLNDDREELQHGKERFTTIAGEIGKQNEKLAGLTVEVSGLTRAQAGIDKKLGQVLQHLGPKQG